MRICVCLNRYISALGINPLQGNHEVAFRCFARIAHTVAVRIKIGRAAQRGRRAVRENQGVLSRRVAVKNVDVITPAQVAVARLGEPEILSEQLFAIAAQYLSKHTRAARRVG